MRINTKIRYGLRTLIEIGQPENKDGIFQKDIAKNQQISEKYLDAIVSALKTAGLIMNVKGKKSGYSLAKDPNDITVYDVYRAFEMETKIVPCLQNKAMCDRVDKCSAMEYWGDLNDTIIHHLMSWSLKKLIDRQTEMNLED